MIKVQRPIDHRDFTAIPRTKEMFRALPEKIRICSEHGKEVTITESEFLPDPGDSAPFAQAAYIGCCDAAIDKVIEGIIKMSGNR
ncbi:MAG TPA: hypothetical protein VHU19_06735 [Pyrinomonadaceae bacterium]|jgi:hypothetical protein|nr:hypothetical protein [Pyrinomonadaceae bacterium]